MKESFVTEEIRLRLQCQENLQHLGEWSSSYIAPSCCSHVSPITINYVQSSPRWERTSVSRLDLQGSEVRGMLAQDSIERGRKFTELLHRAVSVGGLDERSRADVAAACARSCLVGTKVSNWPIYPSPSKLFKLNYLSSYFALLYH